MKTKYALSIGAACIFICSSSFSAQTENLSKGTDSQKKDSSTAASAKFDGTALKISPNLPYIHAPFVFASPFLEGPYSAYDASDLITNWSSINEDLAILQAQKKHANTLEAAGVPYPDRPIISISGYVEGRIYAIDDYNIGRKSDIDLSNAELDVLAQMTPWSSAYMSLSYDSNNPTFGPRYKNSNIYLDRAFLTIGNLDTIPAYGTIGQFYVPFGKYSSDMVIAPVTKTFARTKARALEFGFYKSGLMAAVYTFRGDSDEDKFSGINNAGANLGYQFSIPDKKIKGNFGVGYIYNLADSQGMQSTGGINDGRFVGFGGSTRYSRDVSEKISHAVSAFDAYAKVDVGSVDVRGEYISTLKDFDINDLMFDNHGAQPSALSLELAYRFKPFSDKPAFIAATYGQTSEALALNLPERSYVGTFGISLWKSTVEKIEYRHELNYSYGDVASGGHQPTIITTTPDRVRNIGVFQIDVYF